MGLHVAVIGSGVIGLACASYLQIRGNRVTLIDPAPPGEGCSFGNAGCLSRASCVPLGLPGMWKKVPGWLVDREGPFTIRWRDLHHVVPWMWRLQRSTALTRVESTADALHALLDPTIEKWRVLAAWAGVPELIRQDGYAFAYQSERAFQDDSLGRALRIKRGVQIEVLTGAAVREFDHGLSPTISHLVVMPEQGHVRNPLRLSQALAQRLRDGGADLVPHAAVDFEMRNRSVTGVITKAVRVDADAVVVAAGAHSAPLAAKLGDEVPLATERGYHVMLPHASIAPRIPVCSGEGKFFLTPMEQGLRVAGTVELARVDAPPRFRRADMLVRGAARLLPGIEHGDVTRWMGNRPSMPDSLPVIGRSQKAVNAYFAFGHGHVGLTAAPSTGELVADLVMDAAPKLNTEPYRATRFQR